jgi:D-serine deaminase-like pyridoxal phosphate-dependent protein
VTRPYALSDSDDILTPALAIVPSLVSANCDAVERVIGGPERWRPHVKTVKLAWTIELLLGRGVTRFKCATTAELALLCAGGCPDVLMAYPVVGATARRVAQIAREAAGTTRVSVLVDDADACAPLAGSAVEVFLDLDVGMGRTGIAVDDLARIRLVAGEVSARGLRLRGLHAYDGHLGALPAAARGQAVRAMLGRVAEVERALADLGAIEEIVTGGSLTFGPAAAAPLGATHTLSPGTVVYSDLQTAEGLGDDPLLRPAAVVLSRVVSRPAPGILVCDAGHKSVSADAGVPTCAVAGMPGLRALAPSEEHQPFAIAEGTDAPATGSLVALVPSHVCPTVNLFDHALLIEGGELIGVRPVSARGHEHPLTLAQDGTSSARI